MSVAAVLLDIKKVFDKIWHSALLFNLRELEFLTSLIMLIAFFVTNQKFKFLVEGGSGTSRSHACPIIVQSVHK